jgi:hypothetical protein
MKHWILLLLLWTVVLRADEEGFDVTITPSAEQVSIKDTLSVALDFTFPQGYQLNQESLRQNVLRSSHFYEHPFSIVDMKVEDPRSKRNGSYSQQVVLILQPLRVGQAHLTFYDISFNPKDAKNKVHKLISPIFTVEVTSVEAPAHFEGRLAPLMTFSKTFPLELDEQNRHAFIDGEGVVQRLQKINEEQMHIKQFPWIEIGSVLLILLVFWIFLRHPPVKPSLTAEQIAQAAKAQALATIEQLQEKKLPEKGFFDEFYVQLTQSVRAYIETKYRLSAPTSTTPEFLNEAANNPTFPTQTRQELGQFLYQADKVKFGRFDPTVEECRQAQEQAVHFIKSN